jgi:hypothetical protein
MDHKRAVKVLFGERQTPATGYVSVRQLERRQQWIMHRLRRGEPAAKENTPRGMLRLAAMVPMLHTKCMPHGHSSTGFVSSDGDRH